MSNVDFASSILLLSTRDFPTSPPIAFTKVYDIPPPIKITSTLSNKFSNLNSIDTKNVVSIGETAFGGAKNLESVVIGERALELGKWLFNSCSKLKEVYINAISLNHSTAAQDRFGNAGTEVGGTTVFIGEKCQRIPDYLFAINSFDTLKFLGNSVTEVGGKSFWSASFKDVYLPENLSTNIDNGFP